MAMCEILIFARKHLFDPQDFRENTLWTGETKVDFLEAVCPIISGIKLTQQPSDMAELQYCKDEWAKILPQSCKGLNVKHIKLGNQEGGKAFSTTLYM